MCRCASTLSQACCLVLVPWTALTGSGHSPAWERVCLASQATNAEVVAAEGIASPLALLRETEPARDVLLLSFNANLGFFERFALAAARARQALVTVVGDAGFVHADPMLVRYAGTTYLDGRALCPPRWCVSPEACGDHR